VRATTISLHGIPLRSEEAPFVMMPMKGLQGVPAAWGVVLLRFVSRIDEHGATV
jgi:hypothetical protein